MPGTAAVVNAVVKEKFGIGYGGAAYAKGIKVLKVKKDAASKAIEPDDATIKNGTYPLSRPLFFYTRAKPSADMKAFIDWVLSAEGQGIVTEGGIFPHQIALENAQVRNSCRQCFFAGTSLKRRVHGPLLTWGA